MYNKSLQMLNEEFLYSSLSSNRVLSILVLTGTIVVPGVACHAIISKGTTIYKLLKNEHHLSVGHMNQLLSAISLKFNNDLPTSENLVCETFRAKEGFDSLVRGQCLYDVIHNPESSSF
jgi:hypothetical protein